MGTVSVRSEVGLDDLEVSSNLEILWFCDICEQSLEKVSLLQKSILFPRLLCQSLGISWCSRVLKNILQVYLERSQIIKSYHNCPSIRTNSSLPCECDPVGSPPLPSHLWSRCLQGPPRLSLRPASLSASDGQHMLHSPLFSLHPFPLFSLYFCLFLDMFSPGEHLCSAPLHSCLLPADYSASAGWLVCFYQLKYFFECGTSPF